MNDCVCFCLFGWNDIVRTHRCVEHPVPARSVYLEEKESVSRGSIVCRAFSPPQSNVPTLSLFCLKKDLTKTHIKIKILKTRIRDERITTTPVFSQQLPFNYSNKSYFVLNVNVYFSHFHRTTCGVVEYLARNFSPV